MANVNQAQLMLNFERLKLKINMKEESDVTCKKLKVAQIKSSYIVMKVGRKKIMRSNV